MQTPLAASGGLESAWLRPRSVHNQAAGHKPETKPARTVVTAARPVETVPVDEATYIDFAHLKGQLTMARVLDHLGLAARLRGSGPQHPAPCPIHPPAARAPTFTRTPAPTSSPSLPPPPLP